MKTILKFALTLLALIPFTQVYSQTLRLEAGYIQPTRYSSEASHRYFHGVRVGVSSEYKLPVDYLTIQTAALASYTWSQDIQRFTKFNSDSTLIKSKGIYLDIPVHLKATYKPHKDVQLFAFAGPNLNIGIYHPQEIYVRTKTQPTIDFQKKIGNTEGKSDRHKGDLRRFNLQLEAGAGVQWLKYAIKGGYSFGINDLSRNTLDKQRLSGWYVTLSYQF